MPPIIPCLDGQKLSNQDYFRFTKHRNAPFIS
jgi:hypothetical protein